MIPEMPMPDEYADLHVFSVIKIFDTYRPNVMVQDLSRPKLMSQISIVNFDIADYVQSQQRSISLNSSRHFTRRLHQPQKMTSQVSSSSSISSLLTVTSGVQTALTKAVRALSLSVSTQLQPLPMVLYK